MISNVVNMELEGESIELFLPELPPMILLGTLNEAEEGMRSRIDGPISVSTRYDKLVASVSAMSNAHLLMLQGSEMEERDDDNAVLHIVENPPIPMKRKRRLAHYFYEKSTLTRFALTAQNEQAHIQFLIHAETGGRETKRVLTFKRKRAILTSFARTARNEQANIQFVTHAETGQRETKRLLTFKRETAILTSFALTAGNE